MSAKYSIYAAPRTKHGYYRMCDSKPIYRRDFDSLDVMLEHWNSEIKPKTRAKSGAEYELSMVIESGGKWGHHDKPRYASVALLSEMFRVA